MAHFPLVIGLFDGTIGTGGHQAMLFAANFHGRSGNHRRLRCRTMGRLHHRAIVFTSFRSTIGRLRHGVFHRRRGDSATNGRHSTRAQGRRIGNGRLHRRRHLLRTRGSHFSLGLRKRNDHHALIAGFQGRTGFVILAIGHRFTRANGFHRLRFRRHLFRKGHHIFAIAHHNVAGAIHVIVAGEFSSRNNARGRLQVCTLHRVERHGRRGQRART